MENIGLSRTIYDERNGFRRVGLTVEEQEELSHAVRDMHVRQMRECIEDAMSVLGKTAPSNLVRIACALFERLRHGPRGLKEDARLVVVDR